jgi:hypothetical protein
MTRLMLGVLLTAFAIGSAAAQAPGMCASKAIASDGKPSKAQRRTARDYYDGIERGTLNTRIADAVSQLHLS